MREGTKTALLVKGQLDEEIVQQAIAAAEEAPLEDRVRAGLEAVIASGRDRSRRRPVGPGRAAGRPPRALAQLEGCLGGSASERPSGSAGRSSWPLTELSSPKPDLREPPARAGNGGWKGAGESAALRLGEGPELVAEEVERHRDGDGDRLGGDVAERGRRRSALRARPG